MPMNPTDPTSAPSASAVRTRVIDLSQPGAPSLADVLAGRATTTTLPSGVTVTAGAVLAGDALASLELAGGVAQAPNPAIGGPLAPQLEAALQKVGYAGGVDQFRIDLANYGNEALVGQAAADGIRSAILLALGAEPKFKESNMSLKTADNNSAVFIVPESPDLRPAMLVTFGNSFVDPIRLLIDPATLKVAILEGLPTNMPFLDALFGDLPQLRPVPAQIDLSAFPRTKRDVVAVAGTDAEFVKAFFEEMGLIGATAMDRSKLVETFKELATSFQGIMDNGARAGLTPAQIDTVDAGRAQSLDIAEKLELNKYSNLTPGDLNAAIAAHAVFMNALIPRP